MKATIEIPDDLYRRVKAKSALRGQPVREVVVGLFQDWIEEGNADGAGMARQSANKPTPVPAWFGAGRSYATRAVCHDLAAVRKSIAKGRAGVERNR